MDNKQRLKADAITDVTTPTGLVCNDNVVQNLLNVLLKDTCIKVHDARIIWMTCTLCVNVSLKLTHCDDVQKDLHPECLFKFNYCIWH